MNVICRGCTGPDPSVCYCPQPTVLAEGRACDHCTVLVPPLTTYSHDGCVGHEMCVAREALSLIRDFHRPHPDDGRMCVEGCGGGWPCSTRLEVDAALVNARRPDR